jgi:protein ImuB
MGARTACLLVPDLPLRAELRAHPELAEQPLVVASGPDARADIVAVSTHARRSGVRPRSSVAQARAACPEVRVRVASPALERAARDALLDIALSVSPRAALAPRGTGHFTAEGCVFVDASGVGPLFGSETGFASALAERARRQGLPGVVSLASSQTVSLLVARRISEQPGATRVLAPEHESEFLGPLSLDLLAPDDRLAQALTRFGVQTVQDLLRLPRRALAQRLGPEMLGLIARARGEEAEPPLPAPADRRLEEAIDLEAPLDRLEPLSFVLRGLLSRLCERLELRALACGALDLSLELDGGGRDARRVRLAAPTLDLRVLLRLLTLALSDRPPQAAVLGLGLATQGVPRRTDQLDLFRPRGPDPASLNRTLSELESLCGEGRVGSPELPDTHLPTAHAMRPFRAKSETKGTRNAQPRKEARPASSHTASPEGSSVFSPTRPRVLSPRSAAGSKPIDTPVVCTSTSPAPSPALRALRPPVRAEVRVDQGRPSFIRSAVTQGHIIVAAGPWRTTGNWWAEEERFALDHFDVQVSDGIVVRLCFDWLRRVWQIDGIYD